MADKFTIVDIRRTVAEKQFPAITIWNRLEPRPRTNNFERALRAEVRDPLWMLTRQWQMGEFRGEDAGSPVFARVRMSTSRLTTYQPGDGPAEAIDDREPLEVRIEKRPVPFTLGSDKVALDLRLLVGRRWLKQVASIGPYGALFTARYAVTRPDPSRREDAAVCAHPDVWQGFAAVAGRAMDGIAFYQYLKGDPARRAYDGIAVLDAHKPPLDAAAGELAAWIERLITVPSGGDNPAWQPPRLEYRFACSAPRPVGERVFIADEYDHGTLDWHTVDGAAAATLGGPAPTTDHRGTLTRTTIPVPLTYSGMPHPRWWTMEDGRTNFGDIRPDTTDLGKLLFIEFGLVYANDWFILPLTLPAGSIATVDGLVVSDVFGGRTWIEAAGRGPANLWQRWGLFNVSPPEAMPGSRTDADTEVLLMPALPKVQEGEPLEEVIFIRDEMANMVWAIEHTIPAPDGRPRAGSASARETLAYLTRLAAVSGGNPPALPFETDALVRYDLMSTIPEHWIPFIPVRVHGTDREIELQRAGLARVLAGDALPPQKIRPRTSLLRAGLDQPQPAAYRIPEEEVPRSGLRVTQAFQRARGRNGRVFVWLAVQKRAGRGEGSSGLAFDRLLEKPRTD